MPFQHRVNAGVNTAGAATTTTSFSPVGCVVLAAFVRHATVDYTNGTTVSGMNLTWTKIGEVIETGGAHTLLTVWVGYGASPTTGSATVTFSQTPSAGAYGMFDTSDPRGTDPTSGAATNSGTGTSGTVTVTASANKYQVAVFGHNMNEAVTPSALTDIWVELLDYNNTVNIEVQVGGGSTAASASWATSSRWAGCAFEVAASSLDAGDVDEDDVFDAAVFNGILVDEGDEEGPTVAGKPQGVWAILGGPGV